MNSMKKICSICLSEKNVEHVCSSQDLNDSMTSLTEMIDEQLNYLQTFSLNSIHLKCEKELEHWHSSAVKHLQEIFSQRQNDLSQIYHDEVLPQFEEYQKKILFLLQNQILLQLNGENRLEMKQIQLIEKLLEDVEIELNSLKDKGLIEIHLPDLKHFQVPIRIAKLALAARLTDGEKDPLEMLSDEEKSDRNEEKENEEKKTTRNVNEKDLISIFSSNPPPLQQFPLQSNSSTLAFSSNHILLHDQKKLILFDLKQKLDEFQWNDQIYGILVDICWMSSISLFVILTIHSVYLFDPTKSFSGNVPIKIESISPLDRSHVLSSICPMDRDLFLNYHKGVHLDHYRMFSSSQWILQKRYSKNECCETKDIGIRDVRSDGEFLCLSIMQQDDLKWRLDLMSREMVRIRRGVQMDSGENQHKFFSMLIPLYDHRWLFINWFTNKLWIVDQQGKTRIIKESKMRNIRNLCISSHFSHLAIRTEKPSLINIYQLN